MRSLDTNVLLRLVLADVPEQTAAIEALLADGSEKFEVSDIAFAEMVWVLQGGVYNYGRARIAANLRAVLGIQRLKCNRKLQEMALSLYVAHPAISFADACLAAHAELTGATPLLTFDKKLAAALPKTIARI